MVTLLVGLAYPLAALAVVLFGLFACIYQYIRQRRQGHADTPEFFLTARGSVKTFTVAWSFYAGAMGSGALFGPPSICLYSGILGSIAYAVATGLPLIIIGFFGARIRRLMPKVMGLTDFINRRFGRVVAIWMALLMLFNMGIALTAEFTAIGDLFQYVIGSERWPIVVIIGVVSMIYTSWGGLYVSIVTDQWQALLSILFTAIVFVYVAITFRAPLGPLPSNYLGLGYDVSFGNYYGFSSLAVLPISLFTSYVFSEAIWQRCWAAHDSSSLKWGAFWGGIVVTIVVFLFSFAGILAAWGGVWKPASSTDSGNTILFSLLGGRVWLLVIVAVLAVSMSTGQVDSLQNAIVDTISITFVTPLVNCIRRGAKVNLVWIRLMVLALNVPPIVVSLKGYNIVQLFLLANLTTTTSTIPLLMGIIPGRRIQKFVTPFSVALGCILGLQCLFWWAAIEQTADQSYGDSLHNIFLGTYDYPPFLIALGFSIVGMVIGALLEFAFRSIFRREYPYYDLVGMGELSGLVGDDETKIEMEATKANFEARDDLVL